MTQLVRIEYAAAALLNEHYKEKIQAARTYCAAAGYLFGIQIHNTTPPAWMDIFHKLDVPLSFHSPVKSEYFINLAARDESFAMDSVSRSAAVLSAYDADLTVFHGFLMTDTPVIIFNYRRGYEQCMSPVYRAELSVAGTSFCADFRDTEEYQLRLDRVRRRLREIRSRFPAITWCIENDFPLYGAGLLTADAMLRVESYLCLDISHLWLTCILFKLDFAEQVRTIAESGRVKCVHLHVNPYTNRTPIEQLKDGHLPLSVPNEMNLPEVCRVLYENGVNHWVIETSRASLEDLQILSGWIGAS